MTTEGNLHVAASPDDCRQHVGQPDTGGAEKYDIGVGETLREGGVAPAEQTIDRFSEQQHRERGGETEHATDEKGVKCKSRRPLFVAGAKRATDSGRNTAAHGAARQHLLQHD